MATKAQPHRIDWPLTPDSARDIDDMFHDLYTQLSTSILGGTGALTLSDEDLGSLLYISDNDGTVDGLAIDTTAGRFLRTTGTLPAWSTLVLPNTLASGDLVYASSANVAAGLTVGAAGKVIRSTGSLPAYSTFTISDTFATGSIVHASGTNTLTALAVGAAGKIIRSTGTLPAYSTFTIVDTFAAGSIPHASSTDTLTALLIGSAGKILRSTGTLPAWSTSTFADTYARGDILRASAANVVSGLTVGSASTLLKSDGTDPSWGTIELLSAFHSDTLTGTVVRGDLIVGNSTPKWARLAKGAANSVLAGDGTDSAWSTTPTVVTLNTTGDLTSGDQIFERGRSTALGEWIAVSYDSADFTASSGTWTVEAGDVTLNRYMLVGKTILWEFLFVTTSTSTTPGNLRIKIPGGFSAANAVSAQAYTCGFTESGGGTGDRAGWGFFDSTHILIQQQIGITTWPMVTNTLAIFGFVTFEIA